MATINHAYPVKPQNELFPVTVQVGRLLNGQEIKLQSSSATDWPLFTGYGPVLITELTLRLIAFQLGMRQELGNLCFGG